MIWRLFLKHYLYTRRPGAKHVARMLDWDRMRLDAWRHWDERECDGFEAGIDQ